MSKRFFTLLLAAAGHLHVWGGSLACPSQASLWYSHDGIRTGKRVRPRVKAGKIDFDNLDLSCCEVLEVEDGKAFVIKAYAKAMKRNIRIVVHYLESGGYKVYFSTGMDMSGKDIIEFYRTRFQIEFCFRGAKQFAALSHCQARDLRKLDFAFNTSRAGGERRQGHAERILSGNFHRTANSLYEQHLHA